MPIEEPLSPLEALTTRVLRNFPRAAWRKMLLQPYREVMHFEAITGTLLHATAGSPGWSADAGAQAEIAFLAATHLGELDSCPPSTALVRFDDALAALEMAHEMQSLACDARFQVGLASGPCTLVTLRIEGQVLRVLVGEAVERAEAVAGLATPGSIRFAPETYAEVQDIVGGMANWMVTSEFDGETMTAASLTLPPRRNAQLSTFAGLGLT